eukprot:augustus_masked-scaffold_102-processed-gene-0.3-mRNA-1 protein AED:1.00 eAED:1.00 QI:0/0/0/0/1/1/3/0/289
MLGAPMDWCNTPPPPLFTERVVTEVIREHFNRDGIGACCWMDDIILYSSSIEGLFNMTSQIVDTAIEKRIRFNLKKCKWVNAETVWCAKTPFPNMKHELAQIIYLANCLGPSIPKIAELRWHFSPLINLEGKKLKEVEKMQIKVEWKNELRANFRKLLEEIAKAAKLGFEHYDRDKPLLLFTDASDEVWSLALLQYEPENVTNNIKMLRPKPLLFLSEELNGTQKKCHISPKKIYPVLTTSCFNAQAGNNLDSIKVRQVFAVLAVKQSKSSEEEEVTNNEIADTRVNEI